ncbi:2443_t:CDS:2 [Ambispora leptoticha]|uniref:2443_t:CDS:1 n=1 Tax=Ambispora leptoticha TaxID=144679 RepID=A0A9N9CC60_9GLOM|nr:2443_t:CDS:2 [Ambispora leptoticha]
MNKCAAFSVSGAFQDVEDTISSSSSSSSTNNSTESSNSKTNLNHGGTVGSFSRSRSFGAATAEKPTTPYLIVSTPEGNNLQQYFPDDNDHDLEGSSSSFEDGESTLIWDASQAMGLTEGETTISSPPPAYQQLPQTKMKKSNNGSSRNRPRDLSEIPVPSHLKLSSAPSSPRENENDDI